MAQKQEAAAQSLEELDKQIAATEGEIQALRSEIAELEKQALEAERAHAAEWESPKAKDTAARLTEIDMKLRVAPHRLASLEAALNGLKRKKETGIYIELFADQARRQARLADLEKKLGEAEALTRVLKRECGEASMACNAIQNDFFTVETRMKGLGMSGEELDAIRRSIGIFWSR